jgi:ABC-type Fe3+-hydroxamate transport system substrate-binding protein
MNAFPIKGVGVSLALLFTLIVSACSSSQPSTDITLEKKPERVVLLQPYFADYLVALDEADAIVAMPDYFGEPSLPYLQEGMLPKTDSLGRAAEPDLERILSYEPDLIIGTEHDHATVYDELLAIAPTLLVSNDQNWQEVLRLLGKTLEAESQAESFIKRYKERLLQVKTDVSDNSKGTGQETVVFMRVLPKEFRVYGGERQFGELLYHDLNLAAPPDIPLDQWATPVSLEALATINPDPLFVQVGFGHQEDEKSRRIYRELKENPIWKGLTAVQAKQVYEVDHWVMLEAPYVKMETLEIVTKHMVD